jgi:histidinol-phosphate aminotransferase
LKSLSLLRPGIAEIAAYEPEAAHGEAALDANENPYAPPAAFMGKAGELLQSLALNRYPDPTCGALLKAAAGYYGLPPDCLLPGNGSDEFIASLFVAFGGQGRRCLLASPSFSMYALCAKAAGWQVLEEGLDGGWQLTAAFVDRAKKERPELIVLGNPNNPTGRLFDKALLDQLLELDSLLVLDEAYAEFAGINRTAEAVARENLVVLRTLSKAFGLAGLRIGFLAARPELVRQLNKLRLPYNIDALAQGLGALALSMAADFAPALQKVMADKPRLKAGLRAIAGAEVFESDANFFLFRLEGAERLHQSLLGKGLRLRRFGGGRLKNCLRICVGSSAEVDRCLAAFKEWKP